MSYQPNESDFPHSGDNIGSTALDMEEFVDYGEYDNPDHPTGEQYYNLTAALPTNAQSGFSS
jgi:hypothetical protein